MANLGFNFNPASFEPLGDFIAIPKGEWNCILKETKIDTEKQDQPKLVVTFEVIEGSCKGASMDVQLALWTPDDPSRKGGGWGAISRRKLRSITDALGIHGEAEPAEGKDEDELLAAFDASLRSLDAEGLG